ncbi:MAG TPA: SpoIVB peptidase [Acholeplasmataceae bacterium]|jgi:stage IV sporulation protein B|nr:SpoIVB peptidase [Acholeplasmataceae bacterium]
MYLTLLFFIAITFTTSIAASSRNIYVIPGGDSIGLYLETGIYVTGKYEVTTATGAVAPWSRSDIKVGDKIIAVEDVAVSKITNIQEILAGLEEERDLMLTVKRKDATFTTPCRAVKTDKDRWSLGLYVKDHVLGVGTITYILAETRRFGALGHSVIAEELSGELGYISTSMINGIKKSHPGLPGEKHATLSREPLGYITKNTELGVYGNINNLSDFSSVKKIKIAAPDEVKTGPAEIWTVLADNRKERFTVEIVDVKKQTRSGSKGIKIKITDARLLEKTGGIIQGMSGSPIIQNNQLVGAVSHVVIDSPEYGYGVFAMWMVENNI